MNNIQTNLGSRWLGIIGISAVLVFLGVLAGVARNNSGNALSFALPTGPVSGSRTPPAVSPSPGATTTPEPTETYPPTEDWSATETAWPITQVAARATFEAWQTANPFTEPTPIAGIHDFNGPVVYPQYVYENQWANYINNHWVAVFAGAYSDNLAQGIVVFVWNSELYETPLPAGSVHIVAEDNYRLTLLSTDGTIFYFDIPARRFVDSLTEVVPTATPITPSPTATATITDTPGPTATLVPTCAPGPTPEPGAPFCN